MINLRVWMILIDSLIYAFTCLPTCLVDQGFLLLELNRYIWVNSLLWNGPFINCRSFSSLSTEAPSILSIYKIQLATMDLSWGNSDNRFAFPDFYQIGCRCATLQKDTFYWTIAYCLYLYSYHIIHYNLSQLPMIIVY